MKSRLVTAVLVVGIVLAGISLLQAALGSVRLPGNDIGYQNIVVGCMLGDCTRFQGLIELVGGIRVVNTIHVVLFILFVFFVILHGYMGFLGVPRMTVTPPSRSVRCSRP